MKKRVLFSSSLFHALDDASVAVVPMVFPLLYNQQFIIKSYFQIGILSNFGLLITLLFQVVIAYMAGHIEYRFMFLVSYWGITLSLLLLTCSTSFLSFLLLFLLMRVFTSFYHPVGIAWVSKAYARGRIDFAMGVQSGSGNLGVFIAFITSGYLAQSFHWKFALWLWALLALLLGTIGFLAVREISSKSVEREKLDFSSWVQTLRKIKACIPGLAFGGACWGMTIYYASSLLYNKFHIPLGKTGLYLSLWIGIGTITTYLFGALSERMGRYQASLLGFGGATLACFLIGTASRKGIVLLGFLLFGTFLFLIYPALQSYVGDKIAGKNQAQAFSLVANVQLLSGAMVAFLSGFLSDGFGIHSPFILLGFFGFSVFFYYRTQKRSLVHSV